MNLPSEQSTSNEEQLTEAAQEEDPGASFVLVPNGNLIPIVAQREYSSGELSGFVNLLTEDESSLSTAKSESTQSSGACTCSDNTANEDKAAEIHRDPTTDSIGEDDALPFLMDDINEGAPTGIQDGDQLECKPIGLFTGSLPLKFGNDSNIRPALTTCNVVSESNHMQQNGSENSATPTPTQRSPSTSNASETSSALTSSQSSAPNHILEGMHRIDNAFPFLVTNYYSIVFNMQIFSQMYPRPAK